MVTFYKDDILPFFLNLLIFFDCDDESYINLPMLPFTTPFTLLKVMTMLSLKIIRKGRRCIMLMYSKEYVERDTSKKDAKYRLHSKLPENQF